MRFRPLGIEGAVEVTPAQHRDSRGSFLELFRLDAYGEALGHAMVTAQASLSTSVRGVVRGIHFADVPPGQAKLVSCVAGAVLDVVVDLRVGSPGFGHWEAVRLDDQDRRALHLAEGLGHAFCALTSSATLLYLCSEHYRPGHEHAVDPLDPEVGIAWPVAAPRMSTRDATAPSLSEARAAGLLPEYDECRGLVHSASCDQGRGPAPDMSHDRHNARPPTSGR